MHGGILPQAPPPGNRARRGRRSPTCTSAIPALDAAVPACTASFSINQVGKVVITIGGLMKVRARFAAGLLVAGMVLAAGCGGSGGGGGGGGKLTLVAYSTPREAYQALIPGFQETDAGKGVSFSQSYGGSGDQARAVQSGLAADVVAFSLEPDMTKLVEDGLVAKDWNANQYKGMVTDSVVVFVTRKGN